jgi:cyclophilin family peptidyl-prolyl cis-trans isomerase/HEAT repeat protein
MNAETRTFWARTSLFLIAVAWSATCATPPPPRPPTIPVEEKLAWIVSLEDRRILREDPPAPVTPPPPPKGAKAPKTAPPAPPVRDLRQLITDSEPRVRYRAALAIGRVGMSEGIGPLTGALGDTLTDVRQIAAFALGLIGDGSAIPALTKALADPDWGVRGRAAEALGLIGDASAAAAIGTLARDAVSPGRIAALEPDLAGHELPKAPPLPPEAEAFRLAIYALVRLKAYEPLAAAVLGPDGRPIGRWWPIAYALQRIEDPRAGQALLELARGPGRYTTAFAARGLGLVKPAGAAEALLTLVDPKTIDVLVAPSAIRSLGQIGDESAAAALVALVRQLGIDPNVRLEALTALATLRAPAARDLLFDQIADPWPSMRAAALRGIALLDANEFLLAMSGLDPDPHWSVRAALASALAELPAEQAVPKLQPMLADSDRRVVPAVLSALAQVTGTTNADGAATQALEKTLADHLEDSDVVIRMTASRLLGERKTERHAPTLARAYRAWSADTTYLARAAALGAVAASSRDQAVAVLKEAFSDRDWAVRIRALELLRGVDAVAAAAAPAAIRPAPVQPPPVPYSSKELIAPPFSPHLYIETAKGTIEIELAVNDAPLTAQQLVALARRQFFTGLPFHRVVPNFVAQGGDPRGDGEGGPGFTIRDELTPRPYLRGTVGIALDWRDTGGSQFFITHSPQPHLDGRYPIVGHVVAGMEVVDRLQQWDVIQGVRVWDGIRLTRGPVQEKGGD